MFHSQRATISDFPKLRELTDDYIIGFADLTELTPYREYRYGIVIGQRLDSKIIDSIKDSPTIEYFTHYKSINKNLSKLIYQVGEHIISSGYDCKIIEPSEEKPELKYSDYEITLRTPVSHKMIATRAGLGWIGKTDLFISKKFGPRLRLVSLLTNFPLTITEHSIDKSRCGNCVQCVISCPANAATGQLWNISTDRDIFFDAHKCRTKCKELTKKCLNIESASCGICVSVCPVGRL